MNNKFKNLLPIVIIEEDSVSKILLRYIEHNKRHHIKINLFGKTIYPCARCFGLWTGIAMGLIFLSPFWLGVFTAKNFYLIFTISWIFATPSIFDWSTVKLGIRKGNDNTRFIVGILYGIGVIIYFFVLPASIIFKIGTYFLYGTVFHTIRRRYHIKHYTIES